MSMTDWGQHSTQMLTDYLTFSQQIMDDYEQHAGNRVYEQASQEILHGAVGDALEIVQELQKRADLSASQKGNRAS